MEMGAGNECALPKLSRERDCWWVAPEGKGESLNLCLWRAGGLGRVYYTVLDRTQESKERSLHGVSSVQFSRLVMSDSLWPHEPQHARPPCPSQLPEFTQTHVHCVGDAIQPSHPLSSPSLALNLSQHQGLFKWVSSSLSIRTSKNLIWCFFFF